MNMVKRVLLGALVFVSSLAHASVLGDYRFENSLANSLGAAGSLTAVGPQSGSPYSSVSLYGGTRSVYTTAGTTGVNNNSGLAAGMSGLLTATGDYSIEMVVSLQSLGGWRKLVDFSNRVSDAGLYVHPSSQLAVYPATSGGGVLSQNTFYYVVFTKAAGVVSGYLNGTGSFSLATNAADFSGGSTTLNFFTDDAATGYGEFTNVSVSLLRVRNNALNANEIGALSANPFTPVPEPSTWFALGLGGLALARRRRTR